MTDQDLVKGDAPYPNRLVVKDVPVKAALVFVKGELATFDATGNLIKLTSTRIAGLCQVRNAVTGGAADGDVTVSCNMVGSRILVTAPVNTSVGNLLQINGADGTGNLVISAATVDTANLSAGRIFDLYRSTVEFTAAGDLVVIDLGISG